MKICFASLDAVEWSFKLRMPLRFGVITLRGGIQAVLPDTAAMRLMAWAARPARA